MVLIVLGVSGAGKTTIGRALAQHLHFEFFEGDDFHSRANKEKMHAGLPLTDADRQPWLRALRDLITQVLRRHGNAVVTCSALKQAYRDVLRQPGVRFVYLEIGPKVVRERLARRTDHFFNPDLAQSQFAALEAPLDALAVDANQPPAMIVRAIARQLEA